MPTRRRGIREGLVGARHRLEALTTQVLAVSRAFSLAANSGSIVVQSLEVLDEGVKRSIAKVVPFWGRSFKEAVEKEGRLAKKDLQQDFHAAITEERK